MDRYRVEKDWRELYAKPVPTLRLTAPRAAKRKKRRGALVLNRAFHSSAGLEEAYLAEREAEDRRKGQAALVSAMGSDDDYHGEF
jgi:hypothetical protein